MEYQARKAVGTNGKEREISDGEVEREDQARERCVLKVQRNVRIGSRKT